MNIIEKIVEKALARLEEQKQQPQTPFRRTKEQKRLDDFFRDAPFGCNNDKAMEFASLLADWSPLPEMNKKAPEVFTISYCNDLKTSWIVLGSNKGYRLDGGSSTWKSKCERLATQEEAEAFLNAFATVKPSTLIKWCRDYGVLLPGDIFD